MSTKQSAADGAFKAWIDKSIWRNDRHLPSAVWLAFAAGFTDRGMADIAAVEGERLEHNSPKCIESGTDDCSDCAYHQALDDGKNAIRALDEDGK